MKQPHDTLQSFQMLDISVIPASNTKGTRVKIHDLRFNEKIIIPYDYRFNQILDVALDYLKKNTTLKPYGFGTTKDNYFIVIKPTDHSYTSLKDSRKEGKK